jgi:hypothetical protein
MASIFQMRQEVFDGLTWSRGIQLSRAIMAANARTVLVLGIRIRRVRGQGVVGQGVVSRISHHDFEAVSWVQDVQFGDGSTEPFWRGLFRGKRKTTCQRDHLFIARWQEGKGINKAIAMGVTET